MIINTCEKEQEIAKRRQQREDRMQLATVFNFVDDGLWYIYSPNLGLMKTSKENVKALLNSGWQTRSQSIYDDLEESKTL